ncbi:MAG: 5'-methylthioadenosine/adenosylhomocysteine nucleosidase [Pseudomonadota bacterium]
MTLAILSALHDELAALLPELQGARVERLAGRDFHRGRLAGREVVLVLSGIGKAAAAATAALLCERWQARALVFTGVAGGLAPGVRVGDLVVARQLLQHDLDASPLFPRWEVPGRGRSHFDTPAALAPALELAAAEVLASPHPALQAFGVDAPQVHRGLVVSGDRFVSSADESRRLRTELPQALAVDMESAAVAQVAADFGRPLAVLRSVSDRADDQAHVDFPRFLAEVAAPYAREVVLAALAKGRD